MSTDRRTFLQLLSASALTASFPASIARRSPSADRSSHPAAGQPAIQPTAGQPIAEAEAQADAPAGQLRRNHFGVVDHELIAVAQPVGQVGHHAIVQFAAFNRRTTPELNGEVVGIGADITTDDKKNESYYAVRIRISDKELSRLDGLQPMAGMPVEVFIKTSPRTVVSYLTKPLREQFDRAFRGR